jgi:hypothetical protein
MFFWVLDVAYLAYLAMMPLMLLVFKAALLGDVVLD